MTSQRLGIQWLGQAGLMLRMRFISHLGQKVLRAREKVIPATLGFKLCKHERGKRFLFLIRELGRLRNDFLEKLTHSARLYGVTLPAHPDYAVKA